MTIMFPDWARLPSSRVVSGPDVGERVGLCWQAGAGLAWVGAAQGLTTACHRGAWLDRLAVRAAAASLTVLGRPEDEAGVRDAWHLCRSGSAEEHDPGPAGRTYGFWRRLAGYTAPWIGREEIMSALAGLGLRIDPEMGSVIETALTPDPDNNQPAPLVAARVAAACVHSLPRVHPALPFWLADAVLARRLRWSVVVPLLACGLDRRHARPEAPDWPTTCVTAYVRAAAGACDLFNDLASRAERLQALQGRLRSKQAGAVVAALLANDALAPARLPGGMTDRAGRRLFDRLVTFGAVRELTGRTTFRLYGL